MMSRNRLRLMYLVVILLFAGSSHGADYAQNEELYIKYEQPNQITISSNHINHISLAPLVATTIWGDPAEYSALLSHNGSELFLSSKLEADKSFSLAVQLAGGKVIDLLLHTVETDRPKIVRLKSLGGSMVWLEEKLEIKQLLDAMVSKTKGKYYVMQTKKAVRINADNNEAFASLAVEQNLVYRFGDLVGVVLTLKNKGKKDILIDTKNLSKAFKGVVAVSLHNRLLRKRESMEAFLVLRKGLES